MVHERAYIILSIAGVPTATITISIKNFTITPLEAPEILI
jgi:hypothetical protein